MQSSRFSKCQRGNDGNARDGYHSKPCIAGAKMSQSHHSLLLTACSLLLFKRGASCATDALTNRLFPKKARILHKYSTRLVLNHPSVGSQFHSPPGAWEEERLMARSLKKNTSEHCFIWMTVVWDAVRGGRKLAMLKMKRNIPGKRKRSRAALSFYYVYVGPPLNKEN